MVQPTSNGKNLWVAASDGDMARVKELIEQGATPNDKDSNSYSPMHAAASYHHFALLEYLISVGGDINLPDDEGETPLFTVESVEAAKWLVEHGADPARKNDEGQNAADYHEEDHPDISAYLRSLDPSAASTATGATADADADNAVSRVDAYTSSQADALIEETQRVMAEAAARGEDPEAALKEIVERAVREGLDFGGQLGGLLDDGRKKRRGDEGEGA